MNNADRSNGTSTPSPSAKHRVLLVDDDPDFIDILSENLQHAGLETVLHCSSVTAREWLTAGESCDLILLDWYMPELPGIAFTRAIRDAGIETPIIVLTGVNKEEIEDAALGCGAVDFIDKTRRLSVLLKRIRIALESVPGEEASSDDRDSITIGDLVLYPEHCRAHWRGVEIGLTVTEFNIVRLMAESPRTDFTYRQIYDVVHGTGFFAGDGEEGIRVNVRSLIRRIRKKFKEVSDSFEAIENYPAFGYRWVPEDPTSTRASTASHSPLYLHPGSPNAPLS